MSLIFILFLTLIVLLVGLGSFYILAFYFHFKSWYNEFYEEV